MIILYLDIFGENWKNMKKYDRSCRVVATNFIKSLFFPKEPWVAMGRPQKPMDLVLPSPDAKVDPGDSPFLEETLVLSCLPDPMGSESSNFWGPICSAMFCEPHSMAWSKSQEPSQRTDRTRAETIETEIERYRALSFSWILSRNGFIRQCSQTIYPKIGYPQIQLIINNPLHFFPGFCKKMHKQICIDSYMYFVPTLYCFYVTASILQMISLQVLNKTTWT